MRLIDADALIKRLKEDPLYPLVERYGIENVIKAEPPIKGQICQWIPCKERHPKERGKYLVSFTEGNQLHVSICDWQVTTRHWNLTGCRSYWHPVAWMPLPTPYREETDNVQN